MLYKARIAVILLAGIAAIVGAQFFIPTLYGADGYLHIRMAEFIRLYGFHYPFHWARFSIFADRFADKDFLYHAALIPFTCLPDIFQGAKVAAVVWAVCLFFVFAWVLGKNAARASAPFFLAAFFLSPPFLEILSNPRPMVWMILLTLLFVHALIHKKLLYLGIIAAVYALAHVSSPLLLIFAIIGELIRYANDREFSWKTIRAVSLGLVTGFLLHPHFPNNLGIFYLNGILVPLYAFKWGLELGAEFFPLDTRLFALEYPCIIIGLVMIVALGASRGNVVRTSTKIWLVLSAFFLVTGLFSRRYFIHAYPMFLVAQAAFAADWRRSAPRMPWLRRSRIAQSAACAGAVILTAGLGWTTAKDFRRIAGGARAYNGHFEQVAAWMNQNVPAGETVFHANWSDGQYFIGLSPQHDYFVTLDPIYMYAWDKDKYRLYRNIAFGRLDDPSEALTRVFGVRYGYVSKDYFMGFVNQIHRDSRFHVMAEDGMGLFFMVR